jgi:2-methylisocitrate lyase-like PEP mutase family enzyme
VKRQRKGAAALHQRSDAPFLGQGRDEAQSVGEALDRAKAYAAAGASGFFIPGLKGEFLIGRICDGAPRPVNVMVIDGVPSNALTHPSWFRETGEQQRSATFPLNDSEANISVRRHAVAAHPRLERLGRAAAYL